MGWHGMMVFVCSLSGLDYKNLNLLTNNSISNIMDNDHYVWIGTMEGLNLYDKQTL